MTHEEFMRHAAECKRMIDHPQPPDDPDEHAEFQEWIYFENGKRVTVRRRNPNYKLQQRLDDALDRDALCGDEDD